MRDFVFVDTETTGLSHVEDEIVELSYAVNTGPVVGPLFFGVTEVPDFINDLIKFSERGIAGKRSDDSEFEEFKRVSTGQTMVAANPTFDASFLKAEGLFEFHHRMIDLSAFAMGILDLDEMPGQQDIVQLLTAHGYEIPVADHTSHNDVAALQASFYALRDFRKNHLA